MSQTHPTLYTEQRGNQHNRFVQLQKPATVTQGTGFPPAEWKLRVSGYGRVLEQEIEGTEKSIYWTLWPNFEVQCSTGVLAQTFHTGPWSAYKRSLALIQSKMGWDQELVIIWLLGSTQMSQIFIQIRKKLFVLLLNLKIPPMKTQRGPSWWSFSTLPAKIMPFLNSFANPPPNWPLLWTLETASFPTGLTYPQRVGLCFIHLSEGPRITWPRSGGSYLKQEWVDT